jgi:hypothetical protein
VFEREAISKTVKPFDTVGMSRKSNSPDPTGEDEPFGGKKPRAAVAARLEGP